jgi:hypothetical protein
MGVQLMTHSEPSQLNDAAPSTGAPVDLPADAGDLSVWTAAEDLLPTISTFKFGPVTINTHPCAPVIFHKLALLFRPMTNELYKELLESVRQRGVACPIVMLDGEVLDGRSRITAAQEAGCPYPIVEFLGPDPLLFVLRQTISARLAETSRVKPGESLP